MNRLIHLDEFRQVLAHYVIADASKEKLARTKLALLVSPSSVGRNTIIRELVKTGKYYFIVSDTTRKPRINDGIPEKNGIDYWFRSEEEILTELKKGKFLEAAVIHNQQVSGISIRELEHAHKEQKIAITDIEIVGVNSIVAVKPDAHIIFVLPPSFGEWQRRIQHRGDMDSSEYRRRLQSAEIEFEAALKHDFYKFIINDTIPHAIEQIEAIIQGREHDISEAKARKLAIRLHKETAAILKV